jgi:putative membrane protein
MRRTVAVEEATTEATMMWWNDGAAGASQWLFMTLMMLILWGGLIAFGVWAVRGLTRDTASRPPTPPEASIASRADEVLAERYARGEIDETEYTRRRVVLHPTPR